MAILDISNTNNSETSGTFNYLSRYKVDFVIQIVREVGVVREFREVGVNIHAAFCVRGKVFRLDHLRFCVFLLKIR